MKSARRPLFVPLLALACAACASDAPLKPNENSEATTRKIAAYIADLDSDDFVKREEAVKGLIETGEPAVAPLKQALKEKERSPEFAARALKVVELYELSSPETNGIVCALEADRKAVKPGESVVLTVSLANRGERDLLLYVGESNWGNKFECGYAVCRVTTKGVGAERELVYLASVDMLMSCKFGNHRLYARLPAGETKSYRCKVHFDQAYVGSNGEKRGSEPGLSLGDDRGAFLAAPMEGTVRLSVIHSVVADKRGLAIDNGDDCSIDGIFRQKVEAKDLEGLEAWSGELRSNDVKIAIEPAGSAQSGK
ncbi:MAG: hypothetical protein L6R28_04495 [Planctomycetes bacterium]|nr:hypothetical protein [Planctomycetota bacterium]